MNVSPMWITPADVTAVIGRDTMLGMQFHPEKSQHIGLRMIANFLTWKP